MCSVHAGQLSLLSLAGRDEKIRWMKSGKTENALRILVVYIITDDCVSKAGNAIASVRPSVRLFPLLCFVLSDL